MKVRSTKFSGLKIITSKTYRDKRGFFQENFKQKFFKKEKFIFNCISSSKKNVLRGIHIQTKNGQGKYVAVVKGAILDVVVDLRKNSKTFSKHYKTVISDKNNKSIYIPPGFAHGFLGLKKENIIYYLNTQYQNKKSAIGIVWNDKDLNIKWPIKNPILSKQDKKNITFKSFKKFYLRKVQK